jgi:hypothetical protein
MIELEALKQPHKIMEVSNWIFDYDINTINIFKGIIFKESSLK